MSTQETVVPMLGDSSKNASSGNETSTLRFLVRVLGFGSILIFANTYWIVAAENRVVWELTNFAFFPTVLFTLFALSLLNLAVRRIAPKQALTASELGILYVMISVATALAGHDIIRQLVPLIGNGFWFATPENEWAELFHPNLPSWLTVSDLDVLRGYYEGDEPFWTARNLQAWSQPVLAWSAFVIVLLFVMLCVNIILRKQWIEHEKLNYPIAQMPIEVIRDDRGFFSNRLMWIGFGIAFALEILAGLHYLYPVVPFIQLKYNVGQYFREKPWNAMGGLYIYVYPFAVGLAYLMPLALSFSLWFFYLLGKAQFVLFSTFGWPIGDRWMGDYRVGAWISISLIALWTSRRHIGTVLRNVFRSRADESGRPDRTYQLAVYGLAAGALFIFLFWKIAGMSWWMIILYFGIYLLLAIAITRMRAELGPPTHELHGMHPDNLMVIFVGSRPLGAKNLSLTTLNSWLAYGYRCHPMPHQMEGFKIASALKIRESRLITAMIVASVVGTVLAIGLHVVLYYKYRFALWGVGEFSRLASWINNPRSPDILNIRRISFGFFFATVLAMLKRRFIWWPFYPVGYAVGGGWAMGWMWFSIFLGWATKRVLFSAGGVRYYRRWLPFFVGFIFGQFLAGSLWSLIGILTNRNMYTLFP